MVRCTGWVLLGLMACAAREAPVVAPTVTSRVVPAVTEEEVTRELRRAPEVERGDAMADLLDYPPEVEEAFERSLPPPPTAAELAASKAAYAREAAEDAKGPLMVQLASVRLIQDCPDLGEIARRSIDRKARIHECMQSTVQLYVRGVLSEPGVLTVEAVRVFDAQSKRLYGPAQLRVPTLWNAAEQRYVPWDGRVGAARHISFDLSDPQVKGGSAEPDSLVIEIEVSIDGRRWTLRSGSIFREDRGHMIT